MVLGILGMMLSSVAPWTTIAPTQLPASSRLASLRLPPNALCSCGLDVVSRPCRGRPCCMRSARSALPALPPPLVTACPCPVTILASPCFLSHAGLSLRCRPAPAGQGLCPLHDGHLHLPRQLPASSRCSGGFADCVHCIPVAGKAAAGGRLMLHGSVRWARARGSSEGRPIPRWGWGTGRWSGEAGHEFPNAPRGTGLPVACS